MGTLKNVLTSASVLSMGQRDDSSSNALKTDVIQTDLSFYLDELAVAHNILCGI